MCAIAGIIGLSAGENVCSSFLETMRRRGPDGKGIYKKDNCTLLHTRLAIIDPEGGKQPMQCNWREAQYTIVYNGELYNTAEIRKLLIRAGHDFKTRTDTEVVLRAFIQWGEESLQLLNGIFAFAVWNEEEKSLFLARDRMGVKPLFYMLHNGGLIFSSEIKTILAYPSVTAKLDTIGAAQVLLLGPGRIPGSGVLKDILEIKPGHCGYYRDGRLYTRCYWKLTDRIHTDNFEDTVAHVRHLVLDAVRRQMVSDVPVGTFLSGGLDSSLISAICAEQFAKSGSKLTTFSLGYQDNEKYFKPGRFQPNSDTGFIQIMEQYLQPEAVHTILTSEQLAESLYSSVEARDLPGMADVDGSLLTFCGEIKTHVKVALSGECADEIFGGYPWYRDPEIRATEGFPWAQNTQLRARLLPGWLKKEVDATSFVNALYQDTLRHADILPENTPLERRMKEMVNLNYSWFMQTLLDRKDRMSMYNGLEVRVPFCDYRIAEYLYAVPWEFKDFQGCEKGLLRYAMQGILPNEILWRKKSPYPKTYDPKYFHFVSERLRQVLLNKEAPLHCLVDKTVLDELIDGQMPWPWYGQLMQVPQTVAYFLQLNHWLEYYQVDIA